MTKAILFLLSLLLTARGAYATTIVMPSDDEFIAQATVIARVNVKSITSAVDDHDSITTAITLDVTKAYRGAVPGQTLTIYQPGGKVGDRIEWVDGSPEYRVGESVLVFLATMKDGSLTTHLLRHGRKLPAEAQAFEARLSGSASFSTPVYKQRTILGPAETQQVFHYLAPLACWRAGIGWSGSDTNPHCAASSFAEGLTVPVSSSLLPDAGIGETASRQALHDAAQAWTTAGTQLVVTDGPVLPAAAGLNCLLYQITVSFNDPGGDIPAPVDCTGELALTKTCTWRYDTLGIYPYSILAAATVLADGFQSCPFWTPTNVTETVTHEMGHAVGLAHSCESFTGCNALEDDATMRWSAHDDGRGATLHEYDGEAFRLLYFNGQPTPTPGPTPIPTISDMTGQANLYFNRTGVRWVSRWWIDSRIRGPVDLTQGMTVSLQSLFDRVEFSAPGSRSPRKLESHQQAGTLLAFQPKNSPLTKINFTSTAVPEGFSTKNKGVVNVTITSGSHVSSALVQCSIQLQLTSSTRRVYFCR